MLPYELEKCLACNPVIAAIQDDKWQEALRSPVQVLFYLPVDLLTVKERVQQAHDAGKYVLIHIDLAEGIGRDKTGIRYLAQCGVGRVISTRASIIVTKSVEQTKRGRDKRPLFVW